MVRQQRHLLLQLLHLSLKLLQLLLVNVDTKALNQDLILIKAQLRSNLLQLL